jgi:Mg2+-importing ATPase
MLIAVVVAALRYSDQRELYRLARSARPSWVLIALLLQAGTYLFEGQIWRTVTRAAGASLSTRTSYWLSLAKLLVDQVLPSAGVSGDVMMVKALERRGIPRPVVMAGVVVDTASCYATYVLGLGAALVIHLVHHQSSALVLFTSIPFVLGGVGVTVAVLALSGHRAGPILERLARVGPLKKALAFFAAADRSLARRPRLLVQASACQAAILLLDAATLWVLIEALGATAPPAGVFASFMISTLFRVVGVVPGGLGVFEAASVLTLKAIGVGLPAALAATLLFRGLSFWLPMLPGLWFARRAVAGNADEGGDERHAPSEMSSEKAERLSGEDAARWYMGTPRNPMVIGALLRFDQRLSLEVLEELIRGKLVPHRRFRQHVAAPEHRFARPSWRDDVAFDLGEHVRKLRPPSAVDGDALVQLVGDRMSAPLPPERSPWTLELVDLSPEGSAIIARFHHCIADGRALVSLLEELGAALGRATTETPAGPRSPGEARPGGLRAWFTGLVRVFTLSADPAGFLRRPPGGLKRVAWSVSIPMDTVKSIARATGHHVADVLLASVAGALDRYARDHGQVPRSVRALLPVAAPSDSPRDGLGNHFASVFVPLPIAIPDPRARLEIIAREVAAVRRGGEPRMAIGLMRLAAAAAPALERWAVRRWARRASLVVSSLAGPARPVHLAGQRARSIVVWAPAAASVGLSVTFFGYAGTLGLGVLADGAVIDRPEELVAAIGAAFEELRRGALPDSP